MKKTITIAVVITTCFVIAIFAGYGDDTQGTVKSIRNSQLKASLTAVPGITNYQGVLTNKDGTSLDTTVTMTFRIYDSEEGISALWTGEHYTVDVQSGLFNVPLDVGGIINSLEGWEGGDIYLGVTVGGDSEMTPRQRIGSVPFAYSVNGLSTTAEGNIGIGMTAPNAALHIGGDYPPEWPISSLPFALAINSSTDPNKQLRVGFGESDSSAFITAIEFESWLRSAGNPSTRSLELPPEDFNLTPIKIECSIFDLNEVFFVSAAGNVGIGTKRPRTQLHVLGRISSGLDNTSAGAMTFYPPDRKAWFHIDNGPEVRPTGRLRISHGQNPGDNEIMSITQVGRVGIGTTNPDRPLTIQGTTEHSQWISLKDHDGTTKWHINNQGAGLNFAETGVADYRLFLDEGGNVGIGTNEPERSLHIHYHGEPQLRLSDNNGSWDLWAGSNFVIRDSGEDRLRINGNTGHVSVDVLQINGGMDIAEPFDVVEPDAIEPGMVVVIDPENPEKLKISDKAYDRCVAGIVSGAGGIKPGMTLTQEDTFEGNHQVALTGRVYGLCDVSYGSIEPGDLLTSSPTPGYAMKVTDYEQAQGAILGKAMTSLEEGQGLVLILVSLQ